MFGDSYRFIDSTEILETGGWRAAEPLPSGRAGLQAATVADTIYVFGRNYQPLDIIGSFLSGGYDGSFFLNSILRYNATNNTWQEAGQMKEKRSRHSVGLIEDVTKHCP